MDKLKSVATKICQFKCRHQSKLTALFRFLRTIRTLMQGPNLAVFREDGFPLVESFHLNLVWRNRAGCSGELKWLNFKVFRITGQSGFWHKGENKTFFKGILLYWWRGFQGDLNEGIELCNFGEKCDINFWNFKTICAFWRFLNVRTSKWYVPADLFPK